MAFPKIPDGIRPILEKAGLIALFLWLAQDFTSWVSNWIWPDNSFKPPHLADSIANNDSMYYSTTASKMVYKDSAGAVHNLY